MPATSETIGRPGEARRFDPDRPLPDDLLRQVLHLATRAPSAFNLQPWRFLVVRSASNRRKLRSAAYNQPRITEAPVVVIVLGYQAPERSHLASVVGSMQALGAVSPDEAAEWNARAEQALARATNRALWATRSAMLAASGVLFAAESLGVASALIDDLDPTRIREVFGVPDDHTICCLIALGFASEPSPFLGRLGLAEIGFEEHFGQPWTLGDVEPPQDSTAP